MIRTRVKIIILAITKLIKAEYVPNFKNDIKMVVFF